MTSFQILWHKSTIFKAIIKGNAEPETNQNAVKHNNWQVKMKPFTAAPEIKAKPKTLSSQTSVDDDSEDYTTRANLQKLMEGYPVQEGYQVALEYQVGMSCMDFFDTYFADDAEHPYSEYYEARGEKKIVIGEWRTP